MSQRYVLEHVPPRSLRDCYTPRTLNAAFGPYAQLDVQRRRPDRGLYLAIAVLAVCVCALVLAGITR